jgi:hypothetical protein
MAGAKKETPAQKGTPAEKKKVGKPAATNEDGEKKGKGGEGGHGKK